jgi:hypothetical protein
VKPGDSVTTLKPASRAHAVAHATAETVTTACGIRFRRARLVYNQRRQQPCAACAAAIERETA